MTVSEMKASIKKCLRAASAACAPAFTKKAEMDGSTARNLITGCAAKPAGTCFAQNHLGNIRCDLQIVVPAYNVEQYLESCMESILSQKTKYTFHVVLVDDGAKDKTPELCDRYADNPKVTVIHQKNRGLSGARNTGLQNLFGKYILLVDSDDILCEGAIEGLLDTALLYDCDLVEGGAYYLKENSMSVMHRYDSDRWVQNPYEEIHGHAWGKLYKRELFENLCFPEGYWYEDSVLSFLMFSLAKKTCVSKQMAYAYRINESGIVKTSVGKPRAVETYWITEQLLSERKQRNLPMDARFFAFMLLQIRLNQLRVKDLSVEIQEAVFVLTCDLLEQYFPESVMTGRERNLIRALKERDFGMFRMCCKFF